MTNLLKCMALAIAIPFATSCLAEEPQPETQKPFEPSGNTKTLVVYFSAEGHTKTVAEAIQEETGSDIFRIEAQTHTPLILMTTPTGFRMRLTTIFVPKPKLTFLKNRLPHTTQSLSGPLYGGISQLWLSAHFWNITI